MDLHLVSGFLGSGKTTAIVQVSKSLMRKGLKIGVITNDQGKYLVDTAFMHAADIPVVDVQSGCFCSHYHDFIEQIEHLRETVDPDAIFAESIGTASNLVGSIVQPLLNGTSCYAKSLSVLADARLLLRFCQGIPLPFSDSVRKLYTSQINESDCLIVNKIDLVSESDISLLKTRLPEHFSGKRTLFLSALSEHDIQAWYGLISRMETVGQHASGMDALTQRLALDRFKWYEKVFDLSDEYDIHDMLVEKLDKLLNVLEHAHCLIGHIKCLIRTEDNAYFKTSILSFDDKSWISSLSQLHAKSATIILNARIDTHESIDTFFREI